MTRLLAEEDDVAAGPAPVTVADLADRLATAEGGSAAGAAADVLVTDVTCDSREVVPGACFVAVPGTVADGMTWIAQAAAAGAACIVAEREPDTPPTAAPASGLPTGSAVPVLRVPDARIAAGRAAALVHGDPAADLTCVGITGTNGKTTTAHLLDRILTAAGRSGALFGTVHHRPAGSTVSAPTTTPDAPTLIRMLAEARDAGGEYAVLEVSSHALVQHRTEGVAMDVAVFTNLSHDHLDYHGSLEDYRAAKTLLFEGLRPGAVAVVNVTGPAAEVGEHMIAAAESTGARAVRCTVVVAPEEDRSDAPDVADTTDADVTAVVLAGDLTGSTIHLTGLGLDADVRLPLTGRHNVENAALAAAAALAIGVDPAHVESGLGSARAVPGRLERVRGPLGAEEDQPIVLVDYAHTADALERVLQAVRPLVTGRLTCVFGCGGDRDRDKRPLMGRAAEANSDRTWVTSDNPRSEDPDAIIADIVAGMSDPDARTVEPDRRAAIHGAVAAAGPGDCVLIAGKGHETHQILADATVPFDDRQEARAALAARSTDPGGEA